MGLIPAFTAGVEETVFASPPMEDGLPDYRILAASRAAARLCGEKRLRVFAMGGAQAIAALAFGTRSVPKVDVIVGPGNKYVAAAKRLLFGEVGIDFIAGPTDVLVIADGSAGKSGAYTAAELAASDLLAQAEHDPDAVPRALVNSRELAAALEAALEQQLRALREESQNTARASLEKSGVIIVYRTREEAVRAANIIAPEHLELQVSGADAWTPLLKNYGSLFIGEEAAEVLGDYSAGINHTLPTSGSARFTGGLSVRHFLKTVTTLRGAGVPGDALRTAEILGRAEGLSGHAESAALRLRTS
jgi:histidinol dehydrogenase